MLQHINSFKIEFITTVFVKGTVKHAREHERENIHMQRGY